MSIYYVYAYLRSKDSSTAPKGTPYYIGKGSKGRAYSVQHYAYLPKNRSNIVFLESNLSENQAFYIEKFLIACCGRIDLGTGILRNRTDGGDGTSGHIHTNEAKVKMSNCQKGINNTFYGKHHSEENKIKHSIFMKGKRIGKNHPMYGKQHPEETIEILRAASLGKNNPMYGKRHSEESKAKISAASKGKYAGENSHLYGKHLSDTTKAKMSAARLAMPIVECPHCGKHGKGSNMTRWHFDNCKFKNESNSALL